MIIKKVLVIVQAAKPRYLENFGLFRNSPFRALILFGLIQRLASDIYSLYQPSVIVFAYYLLSSIQHPPS